jgi:hypothetical protein
VHNTTVLQSQLEVEAIEAIEELTDVVAVSNRRILRLTWVLVVLTFIGTGLALAALLR